MEPDGNRLKVRGLTVTSGHGRTLLDIAELDIASGTALGVRGPSGAGKSTFLFALAGLAERARGEVFWGRENVLTLPEGARAEFRRRRMGMVFQDSLLFDELGAADNAALLSVFAPKEERTDLRGRSRRLLEEFGVPTDARTLATFSGGERQRVAVARALAHSPETILADEPTANLDRRNADVLIRNLLEHARSKSATLVAVSHDERLLSAMDTVLHLEHGRRVRTSEDAE